MGFAFSGNKPIIPAPWIGRFDTIAFLQPPPAGLGSGG